jgi:transposase-like protein
LTSPAPPVQPTIIEFLSAWAKDRDIIKRSRIPTEKKMMAALLCFSGYTYRDVSKILGGISHVAVHDAHKSVMAAMPHLEKKDRTVTIDENAAYLNGQTQAIVWMARDADSGEILALRCSLTKSPQDGKKFIESVLASCNGRPLLRVGRGPAFPHSLRSLDYYFKIDTSGTQKFRQRITTFFFGGSELKPS